VNIERLRRKEIDYDEQTEGQQQFTKKTDELIRQS
jgi:hypothetical protein